MTQDDLDAIGARADAATPGEWDSNGAPELWCDAPGEHAGAYLANFARHDDYQSGATDALFCAHARTDVPRLVALARQLLPLQDLLEESDAYREVVRLRGENRELRADLNLLAEKLPTAWEMATGTNAHPDLQEYLMVLARIARAALDLPAAAPTT